MVRIVLWNLVIGWTNRHAWVHGGNCNIRIPQLLYQGQYTSNLSQWVSTLFAHRYMHQWSDTYFVMAAKQVMQRIGQYHLLSKRQAFALEVGLSMCPKAAIQAKEIQISRLSRRVNIPGSLIPIVKRPLSLFLCEKWLLATGIKTQGCWLASWKLCAKDLKSSLNFGISRRAQKRVNKQVNNFFLNLYSL